MITGEIRDLIEPEESGDDEEDELVPHLTAPPKIEQEIKTFQIHPREERRRERADKGIYSDDGRKRQEVGIQHSSHGLARLCLSSSSQLVLMEFFLF